MMRTTTTCSRAYPPERRRRQVEESNQLITPAAVHVDLELGAGPAPLVVPNGVDLSRYEFRGERRGTGALLFVGDLSWPPNAERLYFVALPAPFE